MPAPGNLSRIDAATLCLINVRREADRLGPLADNAKLDRAAFGHSQDMARRGYFDHVSPGGSSLVSRLVAVGFLRGGRFSLAENIAWGTSGAASPASEVNMWMNSPDHRANILNGRYHRSGVGVSPGVPDHSAAGQPGATYTEDFSS
jgi:uncharacterized protein YkwD